MSYGATNVTWVATGKVEGDSMGYEAPAIRKLGSIAELTEENYLWRPLAVQSSPVNEEPPPIPT